ncbi:hypothetical protein C8A05DRAFT_48112 [Staphylotrichum tortipilum]|uniref:Uncharacterized protein n=1 Tax=Staphylotrichum tortipilum TaxID=2831512 RepID=A0AAN6MBV0_9PEZI|nr:hypothetical protein C8A05DRAFT_48112 [Staphylotrichum longicolle]
MAAVAAVRVLSVVGTLLKFVPFIADNFAPADKPASTILFTVGLDVAGGLQNAGGDLPDVRLFNEGGEFIGIKVDPGSVGDGSTGTIKVEHNDKNGQQAAYALFSANDDAVCVASISITWPNGDQYGWLGDWGQVCGGSWYFSNVFVKGTDYKPNCLWIDGNGDQPQTGFQIHFPEFVTRSEDPNPTAAGDINYYCNAGPPFKLYTDREPRGITYWVLNSRRGLPRRGTTQAATATSHGPARRDLTTTNTPTNLTTATTAPPPGSRFDNLLVLSAEASHSASQLCGSASSAGPDFAHAGEKLFCRMSDKSLWPFCDVASGVVDECFNVDAQELVVGGKVRRGGYGRVVNWGGETAGGEGQTCLASVETSPGE